MSWDISVSHEEVDGRARLIIEADPGVPDIVISTVAGAYWEEEIYYGDEWDEELGELDDGPRGPSGLHG